mmetsp:Transcript_74225/g.194672  ORF Transcript_74225/g.194672 Transcript_74225/m.194672 type:complete len:450 (+) Transcript_74225:40-1389(+)
MTTKVAADDSVAMLGDLYKMCTFLSPPLGGWTCTFDCFGRALRVVVAFYFLLCTRPMELFSYLVKFHQLFHWGGLSWTIVAVSFPVWPLAMFLYVCWTMLRDVIWPKEVNCFFVPPNGIFARWLWAFYMEASVPLAIFITHGDSTAAVMNAFHDYVLTKPFWRKHMEKTNMPFPLQLGVWDGAECDWWMRAKGQSDDYQLGDIVLKLMDGCLGRGDTFLEKGKNGFDGSLGAVTKVLETKYAKSTGVLVLEWVRPGKGHEVHSFDIITMVQPDDSIKLVSCLYWGNCRGGGSSTHDAAAGFVIDVEKETVIASASWYSALFAQTMGQVGQAKKGSGIGHGEVGIGSKFPGIKEICAKAIQGHHSALKEQPWLHMIGWDAMFSTTGPIFFEGNYASHRMPRRVFLTWKHTLWFLLKSARFSSIQAKRIADHESAQPAIKTTKNKAIKTTA